MFKNIKENRFWVLLSHVYQCIKCMYRQQKCMHTYNKQQCYIQLKCRKQGIRCNGLLNLDWINSVSKLWFWFSFLPYLQFSFLYLILMMNEIYLVFRYFMQFIPIILLGHIMKHLVKLYLTCSLNPLVLQYGGKGTHSPI